MTRNIRCGISALASRRLVETYGSGRRGAEMSVEYWPTVRDSFMHLRDDWSPIEWEYMKDTLSTVRRMTLPMVETMAGVFTARFGSRFADYAFLEKLCIIDAAWVEATRGEKVKQPILRAARVKDRDLPPIIKSRTPTPQEDSQ